MRFSIKMGGGEGGESVKKKDAWLFYCFEYSRLETFFLNKILDIKSRLGPEKAILDLVQLPQFATVLYNSLI